MVEDEKYIAEAVAQVLKKYHYLVDLAFDGVEGLDYAQSDIYDVIILDVMLPKMDGFEVLKSIRKQKLNTPIIMLTAKGEVEDKVQGLDNGADDYLTKPFHTDELLARIRSLTRRNIDTYQPDGLTFSDITFDEKSLVLTCRLQQQILSPKESQLLELFLRNPHTVLSKETILVKLWGYDSDAEENRVEIYVSLLRKRLRHLTANVGIRTIRQVGYILDEGKEA